MGGGGVNSRFLDWCPSCINVSTVRSDISEVDLRYWVLAKLVRCDNSLQ